jgi:3-phenylpropionate/trans-cinnamate dioxygenase ferredoxin subunit
MSINYNKVDPKNLEFVEVADQSELGNGARIFLEIDEFNIVLFNIAGKFFAIGDVCSHDDGPVGEGKLEEYSVICPRHGAGFDVRSGKALSLPAVADIPAFPVRVVEGSIEVGLPFNE